MSSPGNFSDIFFFWAFVLLAGVLVLFAGVMVWVIHRVTGQRREPEPRDQRQHSGAGGTNTYDASTHSATTIQVRDINIGFRALDGGGQPPRPGRLPFWF